MREEQKGEILRSKSRLANPIDRKRGEKGSNSKNPNNSPEALFFAQAFSSNRFSSNGGELID